MFHVLNYPLWKNISVGRQSKTSFQNREYIVTETVQEIYKILNKIKHQFF